MERNKWENGISRVDAIKNRERNSVKNVFMRTMAKNGFSEIDLNFLDYSEKFILNNEFHNAQNHFKSIAPNGEVLSVLNDLIVGMISFSATEIESHGRICCSGEEYRFLTEKDGQASEYTYGGIIYGNSGIADEADIILAGLEFCENIGVKKPTVILGNTEIFRGILNLYAKREEGLERVKSIVSGKVENDVDYAVSQTIQSVKNIEGGSEIIKELATKLDNKQSIDGLLNIFEISNILETYNGIEGLKIKPGYLGRKHYDRGMVFAICDDDGRELVYGARCDCLKGGDVNRCIYIMVNAENALEAAKQYGYISAINDRRITMVVAPSETAIAKSYKVRKDFTNENIMLSVKYNVDPKEVYVLMGKEESGIVLYIDEVGNITHS